MRSKANDPDTSRFVRHLRDARDAMNWQIKISGSSGLIDRNTAQRRKTTEGRPRDVVLDDYRQWTKNSQARGRPTSPFIPF
jgi:hypothetical protein